jgi:hypothetical protein
MELDLPAALEQYESPTCGSSIVPCASKAQLVPACLVNLFKVSALGGKAGLIRIDPWGTFLGSLDRLGNKSFKQSASSHARFSPIAIWI